jgi:hypothetical protein
MKKLIGICGYARSGKDTFYQRSAHYLSQEGKVATRIAFADALKKELDPLLVKTIGISAFTEKDSEKELIRPLLVTYGTELRRKLNPNCWIEAVQNKVIHHINQNEYVFVTDVRYENEAEWIKINNGILIHVQREGVGPANHEEHRQYIRMKKYIHFNICWPTFGNDAIESSDEYVVPTLSALMKNMPEVNQVIEEVM